MRRAVSVVVCLAVLLTAAACGSGGGSSDKAATTTLPGTKDSSTAGNASPATGAPSGSGSASGSDFCAQANAQLQQLSGTNSADTLLPKLMDPSQKAAAAAEVDKLLQEMDQAVKSAPAEIRSDFNTIAQTMRPFFDQLKKADYDYTKVDLSALMTAFSSPALATAIQHIGDYAKTRCGIDVTSTTR